MQTDRRLASTSSRSTCCTSKTGSLFGQFQESDLTRYCPSPKIVAALPRDRWLLTSLLQKAIRRGSVDYAVAAAYCLVALEPDYVASRLSVIAYEDIGVAAVPTLLWTKQVAATIPVRTACDIICLTDCSTESRRYADELARRGLAEWIATATATTLPLIKRAVAWRFVLGLGAGGIRPNRTGDNGRKRALAAVGEAMQLPMGLVAAIHAGTGTHNLHAGLALAHELLYSTPEMVVRRSNKLPVPGRLAGGVMLCALDMYTRAGRLAYRRVLSSAPRLAAILHRDAPHGDPVECVGMLMFHIEGSLLSRRIESPASSAVQAEVENAEAIGVGFESPEGVLKVRRWLRHHQTLIDAARERVIHTVHNASSAA